MKSKGKIAVITILTIAIITLMITITSKENKNIEESDGLKIVTSFYPIYIITANLTQNVPNIELQNLTQNNIGCLHDYTLLTTDMKKIEKANIFIQNGLGLENFINKIQMAYPNLNMINSSNGITNIIKQEEENNPHIWTSIDNYIKQTENIYQQLCKENPQNQEIYTNNYETYIQKLNNLKVNYENQLQNLKEAKAICLNEALVYLAKDLQIQTINIITNHEESTLSAETVKSIIEKMKNENIKVILVGSEDNLNNAQILEKETGAKIYKLETGLTGENDLDSYIKSMTKNLEILKQI